jgi:hypothetical protein
VIYLSIYLSIYGSTVLLWDIGRLFSFLVLYIVGRTPWTEDQPVARPLPTHRKHEQNKRTQTSMSGIRTHFPGVRVSEDSSCLRPCGHRDRRTSLIRFQMSRFLSQSDTSVLMKCFLIRQVCDAQTWEPTEISAFSKVSNTPIIIFPGCVIQAFARSSRL